MNSGDFLLYIYLHFLKECSNFLTVERIVTVAFMGTVVVFGSFTGVALYSRRRKFVYLGGILLSGLNILVLLSLFSVLFRTSFFEMVTLYGGLILFCFYVIYDTQMIIEKRHAGNKDYILHAMELFIGKSRVVVLI
jgi:FtsH-binding integral membrane protein